MSRQKSPCREETGDSRAICPCCGKTVKECMNGTTVDAWTIVEDASLAWGINPQTINQNRSPNVAAARQLAMALIHAALPRFWTTAEIAGLFKRKDHGTVCHAVRKIKSLPESDRQKRLFNALLRRYTDSPSTITTT